MLVSVNIKYIIVQYSFNIKYFFAIYVSVLIAVSDPPTAVNLTCSLQYQPNGKFDIYAVWTLAERPQGLVEAIDRFVVTPQLVDTSHLPAVATIEVYESITIKPNVSLAYGSIQNTSTLLTKINI